MATLDIQNEYFEWLTRAVGVTLEGPDGYLSMMKALFAKRFIWSVANDDNREADGLALRDIFVDQIGARSIELPFDCTVLEMLVALAVRCDHDIIGEPGENLAPYIFWTMIQNLGLDKYDNDHFSGRDVDEILDIWLERKFDKNGKGSIFPVKSDVKSDVKNQRDVEIWYQMESFLNENFDFL